MEFSHSSDNSVKAISFEQVIRYTGTGRHGVGSEKISVWSPVILRVYLDGDSTWSFYAVKDLFDLANSNDVFNAALKQSKLASWYHWPFPGTKHWASRSSALAYRLVTSLLAKARCLRPCREFDFLTKTPYTRALLRSSFFTEDMSKIRILGLSLVRRGRI